MLWYHLLPLVTASLKGCSDGITCRTVNASGLSFDCRFAVPTTTPATNTTVMLLHGFPEWSVMYVNLMRTLSSHGYSSVACNQRGYSPGAAPAGVTNYNYNTLASRCLIKLVPAREWLITKSMSSLRPTSIDGRRSSPSAN